MFDDQNSQATAPAPDDPPIPLAADPLKVVPLGDPPPAAPVRTPAAPAPTFPLMSNDPKVAEAVEYVQTFGYTFDEAVNVVSFEGVKTILADKLAGIRPKTKKSLAGKATHSDECGDVGDTGDHGDIGSNAAGKK
jgi:hypothetical protein